MSDLARTLQLMRESAGMSAKMLADRADVSEALIRKIEGGQHTRVRTTTASMIYQALASHRGVSEELRKRWFDLTGLTEHARVGLELSQTPLVRGAAALAALTRAIPVDHGRAFVLLSELLEAHGASVVLKLLEAATALGSHRISDPLLNQPTIDVPRLPQKPRVSPTVPGAVEQQYTPVVPAAAREGPRRRANRA